jgi:hypothetical protein
VPLPARPKKPKGWVEGRPFLVEGVARLAGAHHVRGWAESIDENGVAPTEQQRLALVDHYTTWALAEHASVASFARFALQLLALGAPSDLISRAIDAQADEVRHAKLGFGLASALVGEAIGPTELSLHNAVNEVTLEEALRLAVREGMIGETLAALEAHVSAQLALAPYLKQGLAVVAEEESQHAELAYAFGAWALQRDPSLASVIEEELQTWQTPEMPQRSGLAYWGILDGPVRREIHQRGLGTVVRPLLEQLVGGSAMA